MGSLALLGYGYLQYSILQGWEKARALESKGGAPEALQAYRTFAKDLRRFDWLRSQFIEEYSQAELAQLKILYEMGEYDKVIELADACAQEKLSDPAAAYFWSGNALFQKGKKEQKPEDAYPWSHRALAQFRKGLEEDVGKDWNLKYNYELVKTLIDQASTSKQEEKSDRVLRKKEEATQKTPQKAKG